MTRSRQGGATNSETIAEGLLFGPGRPKGARRKLATAANITPQPMPQLYAKASLFGCRNALDDQRQVCWRLVRSVTSPHLYPHTSRSVVINNKKTRASLWWG